MKFSDPVVYYHDKCTDGLTAAWLVRLVYPDAEFRPALYNITPVPTDLTGREVILLDFSWKRGDMMRLIGQVSRLLVLDHHKGAKDELANLDGIRDGVEIIFDMNRSGAGLAFDYFLMEESKAVSYGISTFVDYVEDRDLWKFALHESRAMSARIKAAPLTFESLDDLVYRDPMDLIHEGRILLEQQATDVKVIAESAIAADFQGYKAAFVNSSVLQSEVGEHLYNSGFDLAFVWCQDRSGKYRYSVRSAHNGPDILSIVTSFGGGGHAHAGGFLLDSPLPHHT